MQIRFFSSDSDLRKEIQEGICFAHVYVHYIHVCCIHFCSFKNKVATIARTFTVTIKHNTIVIIKYSTYF